MSARTFFVGFLFVFAAYGFFLAWNVKPVSVNAEKKGGDARPAGADGKVPVPPLGDAVEDKNATGILLQIESLAKPEQKDLRIARIPNLFVPAGTAPSPFVAPGPFRATWDGFLKVDLRDKYVFSAEGRGKLKIEIFKPDPATKNEPPEKKKYIRTEVYSASGDDFKKVAGKEEELSKGKNRFIITYESPADGDAIVRLNWRSVTVDANDGFFEESLPPRYLSYDQSNKELRESLRVHQGRELYANLRCEACHGGEHIGANAAKEGMPELTMDAPNLSDAGARLNAHWIAHWVKNPRALRNESSMPALLRGASADKDAADIAAFLSTLGKEKITKLEWVKNDEAIEKGGYVFTNLGCISCHMLPSTQKSDPGRILLSYVRDKWKPAALMKFLKNPEAHYAWIRMPDFRLTDEEINNVSAFILDLPIEEKGEAIPALAANADPAHGKVLVETLGCLNCHNAGDKLASQTKATMFSAIAGDKWASGCLADKEEGMGKAPNFHLNAEQRGALLAFAATDRASLKNEALPDFAERQIASLRCTACHARDGKQPLWDDESPLEEEQAKYKEPEKVKENADPAAEEKKVKQRRPSLTWTGEKLKPEWMTKFIDGKIDYKPRIWLHSRMPGFHSRADLLAKGLSIEHGYPVTNPPDFKADPELAKIGAKLASKSNGTFNCGSCHKVGGENVESKEVFEFPGINLKYVKERLMEPFYYKWMNEPIRMEPGTGMTAFAKGGTNQSEVFNGDGHKQFEALWHWIQEGGRDIKQPASEDEGK